MQTNETILDPATARGFATRMEMREVVRRRTMPPYDDPVLLAIQGVNAGAPVASEALGTDAAGSPSETFFDEHYGRVMAERERLRRMAE